MIVYIAAPFELRKEAAQLRAQLDVVDIGCCSRWIDLFGGQPATELAASDLADVREAHAVVLINPPSYANKGTGGRHVEIGFALALGITIVIHGVKSNIFHELPGVSVTQTVDELVAILRLQR